MYWRLERVSSLQPRKFLSCFRRLRAVGRAATLAFAGVLTGILSAALPLAVILALTGVLGWSRRRILGHKKDACP
jgi:hypothetical protein